MHRMIRPGTLIVTYYASDKALCNEYCYLTLSIAVPTSLRGGFLPDEAIQESKLLLDKVWVALI